MFTNDQTGKLYTGKWIKGDGDGQQLFNAVTGEPIATATTQGLDFKSMTDYARKVGNPALRKMTFHERGRMLKALGLHLRNILINFIRSVIKPAPQKQIAGWILKAALEIYLPMHHCEENFLMKCFVLMGKS